MKKTFILAIIIFATASLQQVFSQGLLDRIKQKTKDKINQKVDEKIDKGLNKTIDGADDAVSGKKKNSASTGEAGDDTLQESKTSGNNESQASAFKSYSKFDFVPGDKILASEDFGQDNVGDFPAKWNTNGSGEIVTTNNATGKFLMTQKQVVFYPEWVSSLPDNFTLEFDLLCSEKFSYYSGYFNVGFTTAANVGKDFGKFAKFGHGRIDNGGGFEAAFHPENAGGGQGITVFYSSNNNEEVLRNEADQDKFMVPSKSKVHISIWRQKTRVRVYMDDKKVWDLPRGIAEGLKFNSFYFRNDGSENDNDAFYVGNVKLAVGAPDTRNKLITEGKFVTHGILFDINSDKIKPESYGTLKDIAGVLASNADVKVKIIGHTDSDGDEKSNADLSRRRAEAVKNTLENEFAIDGARMQAEGKGESQPVDSNSSTTGKANNRRVEFIKQ